jgi:L-aspartate oxidase
VAAALRAGAVLADLEFVQFHPTALHIEGDPRSTPRPLISEAMRGEGAVLRDGDGTPVMAGVHPLGDLAPRDVVTRAVAARMAATGARHLWLDATSIPPDHLERRFPTILARCRAAGIEPSRQPIPVSPAAHYLMGGVLTDLDGRTSLPSLFAVGEAACTGVHGANRLASNSLLEGVVFAARIGRALEEGAWDGGAWDGGGGAVDNRAHPAPEVGYAPPPGDPTAAGPVAGRPGAGLGAERGTEAGEVRARLRRLMTEKVGVVRSGSGLAEAVAELDRLANVDQLAVDPVGPGPEGFETANLVQLGRALAELALRREESRGGHWRSDHPAPVEAWRVRQTLTRAATGDLDVGLLAVPAAAEVGP